MADVNVTNSDVLREGIGEEEKEKNRKFSLLGQGVRFTASGGLRERN
jgi:hypothetical protein